MERGIKLPQSTSEWGFKGENYLLIIGIDQYKHWKPLHNAVKDVRDISRLLTERYQFEPARVITLFDDEATEDNIRKTLLGIKKTITKEDNLVVFYSGHGCYDADLDEGYWVPANARKDNPSDYISNSDVLKWIRSIKTHHTLIVVDSCFSGTLVSQSRSEVLSEKYPSSRIFASGRKELVDDGVPGTNSPFAKAILGRLSYNTDRVLRASELIQNVTKAVESQAGQGPIEGRLRDAGDQGGEFVFHLKVTEEEIWNTVVNKNTAEEYSKYIEYYPDGRHVPAARSKLSELTDAEDWNRALELSTANSLTQYLEAHPRGIHNEDAISRLEELEEIDAWQLAKTRNSVSSLMDYLRKYPSGRFEAIARNKLENLKQDMKQPEQDRVHDELESLIDTSVSTKDNKDQYKKLINEAEGLFAQRAYEESIEKYQQALQLNESHFVPNKAFVFQRIDAAKKKIRYSDFQKDGNDALQIGNYDLALEYFKKAQSIEDSAQVRNNIELAKRRGSILVPPPMPVVRKEKKSTRTAAVMWTIAIIVFVSIVYGIYDAADNTNASASMATDPTNVIQDNSSPSGNIAMTEEEPSAIVNTVATAEMIYGSWIVTDRVIAGVSTAQIGTLIPASWVFHENNTVYYYLGNNTYSGTWYSTGQDLSVTFPSIGNYPGYISEINGGSMVWVTTEVLLGSQVTVTNYLTQAN